MTPYFSVSGLFQSWTVLYKGRGQGGLALYLPIYGSAAGLTFFIPTSRYRLARFL